MTTEQEIKQEMSLRPQQDSFELTYGTPSKGSQVCLKCYFDAIEIAEKGKPDNKADIKIKNILKVRGMLMELGIIQ